MPQSVARVYVHAVFSTKHRVPVLSHEIRTRLYPYMGGILKNLKCYPIQIGGYSDHVHVLFGLSRTITMADAVSKLKSNSSTWLKGTFPECKDFDWQEGYLIKSADPDRCDHLVEYIRNQDEHHKHVPFIEELRMMLESMGMELDERDL